MRSKRQWPIKYASRENIIVDRLVKINLVWKPSLQIFYVTPNKILQFLQQNKSSVAFKQLS